MWSKDSSSLFTGGEDTLIRLWDIRSAPQSPLSPHVTPLLKEFKGHSGPVSAIEMGPENSYIVSGGDEGKIAIFGKPNVAFLTPK